MRYVRWVGLIACSIAALGYAVIGNFNMAGLMLALAVLSWINVRRKRRGPGQDSRDRHLGG